MDAALTISLPDAAATTRLGEALADTLRGGGFVCLAGDLGAGKSHLARSIIQTMQARVGPVEDVPSPTYTLIQTYRAGPATILHADLYRLGDPDELTELGFDDISDDTLYLVEWPDRLGDRTPKTALRIDLSIDGTGRRALLRGRGWAQRLVALTGDGRV